MRDLKKIYDATRSMETAKVKLYDAIREARRDGASLRDIAVAADMSYETVRRICQ